MRDYDLDEHLSHLRDAAAAPAQEDEIVARLVDRLDLEFELSRPTVRDAFRGARRTLLALVAFGGVITGAAATGAIAIAADRPAPAPVQETAEAVDANPTKIAYAAVSASDRRPAGRVKALLTVAARNYDDLDIADARGITAVDGTRAWVVTGTAHTCFGAQNEDGTGYACETNALARRGALSTAAVDGSGKVRAIYLVPDDVLAITAGGATFRPTNNLVAATYDEGDPVTIVRAGGSITTTE